MPKKLIKLVEMMYKRTRIVRIIPCVKTDIVELRVWLLRIRTFYSC